MTTPLLEEFPPVVDDAARLLILGSFPSVPSLATRQHFGNPRNAFWRTNGELFGFDEKAPHGNRQCGLQVRPESVVPNDFGEKAAILFRKLVHVDLTTEVRSAVIVGDGPPSELIHGGG